MVARIFIDGEAGTTGLQIRERLAGRRDLELMAIDPDRRKDQDERKRLLNAADIAILCLPDEAARESVALIENDTTRVIDASTAHRVAAGWAYGFPELGREQAAIIAASKRVANPGCWPQGAIATLRPLVEAGIVPPDHPLTINGISGYSGGGRAMIEEYVAKGAAANAFMPYGLTFSHKHLPELKAYARLAREPLFQPAVGNFAQGMIVMVPLHLAMLPGRPKGADLHAVLADTYRELPHSFVDVAPLVEAERTPELDPQLYNNTNRMRLHVFANEQKGHAVLIAVYDNLGKGAAGAAVQNLNLMLGVDAATSLAA